MENITNQRLITIERLEDFYGATILAFYDHFTFYRNIIHNFQKGNISFYILNTYITFINLSFGYTSFRNIALIVPSFLCRCSNFISKEMDKVIYITNSSKFYSDWMVSLYSLFTVIFNTILLY